MDIPNVENEKDLAGKRVLLRLGLNVPIAEGKVLDGFRIDRGLPTIKFLRDAGAKIVAIGHIGSDGAGSLVPVYEHLKKIFDRISFLSGEISFSRTRERVNLLQNGDILLLDNIRKNKGEVINDPVFASGLAQLADIYVNEAFAVSHREHASVVGVPKILPSFVGALFIDEVMNLSRALKPEVPFYVIFGGAKFSTKLPIVKKFLPVAENIFVYGALAHDMLLAGGHNVGKSLVDMECDVSELIHEEKIVIPKAVLVRTDDGEVKEKQVQDVAEKDTIFDATKTEVNRIIKGVSSARMILWNGPLGNYEEGFTEATELLANELSNHSAHTIVGGGDTIAVTSKLDLFDKFGFVSTGGGAMLEFLAQGTLPGIRALQAN